jgi:glycerate 2-kinase
MNSPLHVLIAPDKFKGTLSAQAAAESISAGWKSIRPQDKLTLLPITDGGDGFGETMARLLRARSRTVRTVDAAGRSRVGQWFWHSKTPTAIIESASVIGLAHLRPYKLHPFDLDTAGLGRVLRAVARKNPKLCLIGIGGSATNDGGFGLAKALGWKFLNYRGEPLQSWTDLHRLHTVTPPSIPLRLPGLLVAVDVQNRLLGPRGATRVYGPQKGLRPRDFPKAEAALRRLAAIVKEQLGFDFTSLPGSGAAGGLGFGLAAFCGAKLVPGFELFAQHTRLERLLGKVDVVITGEGSLDGSSFMGKGVGELAKMCSQASLPCLAIGGRVQLQKHHRQLLKATCALTDLTTREEAERNAKYWISQSAARLSSAMLPLV